MNTSIPTPIPREAVQSGTVSQDSGDPPAGTASTAAWASLVLGIAGLLPVLPLVGSLAAIITGALWANEGPRRSRQVARTGLALGVLGLVAPSVFLFVYCVVLGYPFPIHPYAPGH
ncbi:MAG TPA: hypothetical protein PLT68_08465 [Actinomycetota bacterium]|nr:hypothetical protein [Actinomycetota bacterium]